MDLNKWLTSDWHFGETRFDLMQRPFTDVYEHCELLIKNHNSLVSKNDLVYFLGDVLYQKADPVEFLPMIGRLNGTKILIRGNHDAPFTDEQFQPYFKEIIPDGKGMELDVSGVQCYLTHYPSAGRTDRFNLVGHVHGSWRVQLNMLNVGLDAHYLYPVPFTNIPFHHTAITKYFDQDTFAGYLDVNRSFEATRGRKSSYLDSIKK